MNEQNQGDESEIKIQNAFDFLVEKYKTRELFTKEEFREFTGWEETTFKAYFSKIFKDVLIPKKSNRFQVRETFRKISSWSKFRKHFSQKRSLREEFNRLCYKTVIIYEFFMPLTNEGDLRASLDSLFYKDTIINRLKEVDFKKLKKIFPKKQTETNTEYYERVNNFIQKKFVGYSIGHFQGRFRADALKTFDEVAEIQKIGSKYLIDETTAIVKFIFPCGTPERIEKYNSPSKFFDEIDSESKDNEAIQEEARKIRLLFNLLFVENILQVVSGEDEIWMLESGLRSRLHIFRVEINT
ncbi:MAG: hypothetical protein HWN66_05060 [Candidatus Helarchaeota archaeon]|nr:hypothetical protein [Candidatus Helarchaeota archaeon]